MNNSECCIERRLVYSLTLLGALVGTFSLLCSYSHQDEVSFKIIGYFLERIFSWPAVVYVAIFLFSVPISFALKNGFQVGVGTDGVKIGAGTHLQKEGVPPPPGLEVTNSSAAPVAGPAGYIYGHSSVVQIDMHAIRSDLDKRPDLKTPSERIDLLINHLAAAKFILKCEMVYRNIFGSQIALLRFINSIAYASREQIASFYDNAKKQYPAVYANYSMDSYIQYLLSFSLLSVNDHGYSITALGKEFLKWMTDAGVIEDKQF